MSTKDRQNIYYGIFALLTLTSLLVMNDLTILLEQGESYNILHVQDQISGTTENAVAPFPNTSQFLIYKLFDFSPFWLRMSNVVVFLLLLLGIRIWGAKVFGKPQIITFMMVLISSFLMISMAKFAVADIPLCAFHTMSFLFLIICLKQPKIKWQIVYGLFVMGSFLVQPTGGVIYGIGLLLYMLLFHKNRANLKKPLIFGAWALLTLLFYFLGGFNWSFEGIIFSYQTSWKEYLSFQLLGLLPWLGFLPAALWDLIQKFRRKEEMAIILFGWLIFSLISHALILQVCLLFLIAKQVENYFKPNYPYKNLVKASSVINLIFIFFVLIAVMFGGFATLRNVGFGSTALFSAALWISGFVAIIGLFSENKKYILGSITLGGALSLTLFWVQINPIINQFRDVSTRLVADIEGKGTTIAVSESLVENMQLNTYVKGQQQTLLPYTKNINADYYLLNDEDYKSFAQPAITVDTIVDRSTLLNEEKVVYYKIKNR